MAAFAYYFWLVALLHAQKWLLAGALVGVRAIVTTVLGLANDRSLAADPSLNRKERAILPAVVFAGVFAFALFFDLLLAGGTLLAIKTIGAYLR